MTRSSDLPRQETGRRTPRWDIDALAQEAGITRRTVRFYVQSGLLAAPEGTGRGARYTQSHLLRLREIARLKEGGLTLSDIKEDPPATREPGVLSPPTGACRQHPWPAQPAMATPPHIAASAPCRWATLSAPVRGAWLAIDEAALSSAGVSAEAARGAVATALLALGFFPADPAHDDNR